MHDAWMSAGCYPLPCTVLFSMHICSMLVIQPGSTSEQACACCVFCMCCAQVQGMQRPADMGVLQVSVGVALHVPT